jgi:hypothetical protein
MSSRIGLGSARHLVSEGGSVRQPPLRGTQEVRLVKRGSASEDDSDLTARQRLCALSLAPGGELSPPNVGGDSHDDPCEAEPLQGVDQAAVAIELPAGEAVVRRGGNAWRLLCHVPPNVARASQARLRD